MTSCYSEMFRCVVTRQQISLIMHSDINESKNILKMYETEIYEKKPTKKRFSVFLSSMLSMKHEYVKTCFVVNVDVKMRNILYIFS